MTERRDFDMSGWIELIGEVQQLGLQTARSVASRFGEMAETGMRGGGTGSTPLDAAVGLWNSMMEPAGDAEVQDRIGAAAQSMSDAIVAMMRMGFEMWSQAAQGFNMLSWPAAADLGSVQPGATASGTAYVHVGWGDPPPDVALRVGDLTSGTGAAIDSAAIRLDPAALDRPEAGKTYPVSLEVAVPDDAKAGVYHGHMFVMTEPPSAVAVRLEVSAG